MADEGQTKHVAWRLFDAVIAEAERTHSNPWVSGEGELVRYEPDYQTLQILLGVPIFLGSVSQSGMLAIAVDVWISYELRRAGFDPDAVWPRPTEPRVLPRSLNRLVKGIKGPLHDQVVARYDRRGGSTSSSPAAPASSKILGKNYVKQVDVVMSDWSTGPELLISTKRMDASYGSNALNRVEESYGDAKNLRLRHPLAALGFVFVLSSGVYDKHSNLVPKLKDLLAKLGQEDDAYHAVMLVMPDYGAKDTGKLNTEQLAAAINEDIAGVLTSIPAVSILHEESPLEISPPIFFIEMIRRVLSNTPIDFHADARALRDTPRPSDEDSMSS